MSVYVDIEKRLGSFLLRVKLEAQEETLALLGASGCGKSLTLKCIAGIEKPDKGKIVVDGVTLFDSEKQINLSPQERHVGLMFQNYALFPNMTVLQNIQAGAKREKNRELREKSIRSVVDSFGLTEYACHYPHQLSGGQQQRVALARILVSSPRILLLDEPFSALDSHLRFKLEQEVRQVIRRFGKTVLMVSHDRDEVYRMSDKIAVMDHGVIQAVGSRKEVFANPQTRSGAVLTGCKNISPIRVLGERKVLALDWDMELELEQDAQDAAYVGIRMHDICAEGEVNCFLCRVVEEIENPFSYTVMLRREGCEGTVPIGWEMEKEVWRRMRKEQLTICLPREAILLLKES